MSLNIDSYALLIANCYVLEIKILKVKKKHTMSDTNHNAENNMLRSELELLMKERETLLVIAGAAAGLIAELNSSDLPIRTVEAADLLATHVNHLSEESLQDALTSVHAKIAN